MSVDISSEFPQFSDQLLSYLYRLSANRQDAEDILHDTFIRAKENIHAFRGNSSLKTWVFSIATNLARDNRRVKNRWEADAQDVCKKATMESPGRTGMLVSAFSSQTEKRFEIAEHINYCFTCLAKNLSLEKQIAVILKEIYDFKRTEIAEILGITEGVVKHLLHDGRRELQEKYDHRCAIINKKGICYQCAELNDHLQGHADSEQKIAAYGMKQENTPEQNLDIRLSLISKINPLKSNGAALEDVILQILREAVNDN